MDEKQYNPLAVENMVYQNSGESDIVWSYIVKTHLFFFGGGGLEIMVSKMTDTSGNRASCETVDSLEPI